MQITLMQGILLAIMTIIVGLDFFLEAFFVFRPLMVSTFTGIILGDVVNHQLLLAYVYHSHS